MPPNDVKSSSAIDLEGLSIGDSAAPQTPIEEQPPKPPPRRGQRIPTPDFEDEKVFEQAPTASRAKWEEKEPQTKHEEVTSDDEQHHGNDRRQEKAGRDTSAEDSKAEIQSIIEQFGDEQGIEFSSPPLSPERELPVFHYPPRSSSLDHGVLAPTDESHPLSPVVSSRDPDRASLSYAPSIRSQPPPPEPDPEPDLPFDFHRFLEQLRHRTADPVAKFLRSFLQEFGKKQWQVHEQVKIIGDFLTFIANKMGQSEVWRTVSDAEFDNAKEGMEKLVMNRLYSQTFSPEIPAGEPSPVRRRRITSTPIGPGRRGQHQEDVERDEVLAQKMRIYGWIREEHLDIKPCGEKGKRFLILAQQELAKIRNYRAPRDKVICVLNCCKVIMGYLRNAESDQSADSFIPLLIYTVLKAKPDHLVSNVQYIQRFRNPDKLSGEAGYYMSSLIGAVQFVETLDRTNLTISEAEFDKNVEAAVSDIAKQQEWEEKRFKKSQPQLRDTSSAEKGASSRPHARSRPSIDGEKATPRASLTSSRTDGTSEGSTSDGGPAVVGLLRSIQKPLSSIGRIFSDEGSSTPTLGGGGSRGGSADSDNIMAPPPPPRANRSPARVSSLTGRRRAESYQPAPEQLVDTDRREVESGDAAAMQASADSAEAYTIMQAEHSTVVDTLSGMFPDLDQEIINDVVRMKDGNVGLAVDACLALSR